MTRASYLVDVAGLAFDEQNGVKSSWVHALPIGSFKHQVYGTIDVNAERAKRFADNVNNNVRGIDPSINFVHNNADVAAGWVKKGESRSDGVWLFVEWTNDAATAIAEKKWRYFSSEFEDEWEDNQGAKHKAVMFGGALTNRPFMKNILPVNLSETTVDIAFDLVSAITGKEVDALKGGNGMPLSEDDLKKIVEGVATKLAEGKPTPTPTPEPTPSLREIPELKQLAEENPMVELLIKHVEAQKVEAAQSAVALKEADVQRKLSDFDRSKIVLTPVARKIAAELAMEMPTALSERFWTLMTEMKRGSSFLVELGERAGATVNYGNQKSAVKLFEELSTRVREERKISAADAYEAVANDNPELYRRYRHELMEGA